MHSPEIGVKSIHETNNRLACEFVLKASLPSNVKNAVCFKILRTDDDIFGYHELIYESEYTRPSNGFLTWTKAIIPTQMMETDDPYRMCCIELYQFKE